MSTQRKPGSRGVRDLPSGNPAGMGSRAGKEQPARAKSDGKGSTKTVSPKKAFKRKPRK